MHTITLYLRNNEWLSRHSDPEVRRLFGTDTIPTPYTGKSTAATILERIRALNPDRLVEVYE